MANDFYEHRKNANIFAFSNISKTTQHYLCRVYLLLFAALSLSALSCISLIWLDLKTQPNKFVSLGIPIISLITGLVCFLVLVFTNPRRVKLRFTLWTVFAICEGLSIEGLVKEFVKEPAVIFGAFITTAAIFLCLSGCALLTKRRTFLFLGTFLMFAALGTLFVSIFLVMFPSYVGYLIYLIVTLVLLMLTVLYSTQLMIEMSESGYRDAVLNSASLLIDFIGIFIRILMLFGMSRRRN